MSDDGLPVVGEGLGSLLHGLSAESVQGMIEEVSGVIGLPAVNASNFTPQTEARPPPRAGVNARIAELAAERLQFIPKMSTRGLVAGGSQELRPPPEHEEKALHWVNDHKGAATVAYWYRDDEYWVPVGWGVSASGLELHERGYRYLGPAEYGQRSAEYCQSLMQDANEMTATLERRVAELEAEKAKLKRELREEGADEARAVQPGHVRFIEPEQLTTATAELAALKAKPQPDATLPVEYLSSRIHEAIEVSFEALTAPSAGQAPEPTAPTLPVNALKYSR